jgi:glyoxylate/hydroxypyruvate reductase
MPEFEAAQRERRWIKPRPPNTDERRIGILGLGALGQDAARRLVELGFPVAAWSRAPKCVDDVELFHGSAQLKAFAARSDVLVCLLPLNDETRGIIDARLLAAMPRGAFVINPARGGHVVDADLIAALDSGHIAGATLDVFHTEPLPSGHPFWTHPKVTVTPHIASTTNARSSVPQIVENIRRVRAGKPLLNRVG